MSKKSIFREKTRQNSRESTKKQTSENEDLLRTLLIKDKKSSGNINYSSNSLLKQSTKSRYHMQASQPIKDIYKKKFVCEHCAKHFLSKDVDGVCDTQVDKKRLDIDYIDTLVNKIKELKNSVKLFENHYDFQTVVQNSVVCQYHSENGTIGDFDVRKRSKDKLRLKLSDDDVHTCGDVHRSSFHPQFFKRPKHPTDRQRSIYTNNDPIIAPTLIQDDFTKVSKHQKNKSNASIVMSLHSATHQNDFFKINPHLSPKHFQAAAEEFIEQAEELKSKIGYILECCGYVTPTISNFSESVMPSEMNYRTVNNTTHSRSVDSMNDDLSEPHLKNLFETVSSQYKEILQSLVSIESQIKTLHKHNKPRTKTPELSESSKASPSKIKKPRDKNHKSGTVPKKKSVSPVLPQNSFAMEANKPYFPEREDRTANVCGISRKLLEPVVMVYEPIHPENYDDVLSINTPPLKDNKKDDSKQKYGFVVTYTPDISPDSKTSVPDVKNGKKNKKPTKKKGILPCLGF